MRRNAGALAVCFLALMPEERRDDIDAQAGALRFAEFVNLVCDALTKK